MGKMETLFARPLRRPLDSAARLAINAALDRRLASTSFDLQYRWPAEDTLEVLSRWARVRVSFARQNLVVETQLSFAAKLLATSDHRRRAIEYIEEITAEADL